MKELGKMIQKMMTSLNENEPTIIDEPISQLGMIYEEELGDGSEAESEEEEE